MPLKQLLIEIRMECTAGLSNKFWNGQVHREKGPGQPPKFKYAAHFGPIGKSGITSEKPMPTCHGAFKALLAKIKEKLKKGYRFVEGSNAIAYEEKHFEYDLKLMMAKFAWDYSHLLVVDSLLPNIKNIETWTDKTEKPKEVRRETKMTRLEVEKPAEKFEFGEDEPVFGKTSKPKIERKPLILI